MSIFGGKSQIVQSFIQDIIQSNRYGLQVGNTTWVIWKRHGYVFGFWNWNCRKCGPTFHRVMIVQVPLG
jgi:hypothetical protein